MGLGLEIPVKTGIRRSASKQSPGCARLGVEEGRLTRRAHLSVTRGAGSACQPKKRGEGKGERAACSGGVGPPGNWAERGAGEEEGGGIWLGLSVQNRERDVSPFFFVLVLFSFM